MKRLIFLLFFVSYVYAFDELQREYISFDQAMRLDEFPQAIITTERVVGIDGHVLYTFFKELYERAINCITSPSQELKIPKIIHQIWLGSSVPEVFEPLMQSWIRHHLGREWRYKLWTDQDVENFGLYNKDFYDATDNYGVKSDILRFEIIYRYGGVYVDMDYECLAPLDVLHYSYDFYTALQPLDTLFVQLGAALFGARPGHPILKQCIVKIKDSWHEKGAPKKTGPIHFTKIFYAMAGKESNCDIAFPALYFYPLASRESCIDKKKWKEQGAFAVHWWAKSWMPQKYRSKAFRLIQNEDTVQNWNA